MRTALTALTFMLAAACSSTAPRTSIVVAAPIADPAEADTAAYEQYVDADGHVVTTQANNTKPAKQTSRARLFDHWTAAYLFTR